MLRGWLLETPREMKWRFNPEFTRETLCRTRFAKLI